MTTTPIRSAHPLPGVDPRTGQVGFRLALPSPYGEHLRFLLPDSVSFAPGTPDTGYGSEWALELTTYDSTTGTLTRRGIIQRIGTDGWPTDGTRGVRVTPAAGEAGVYRVAYPDGMVEILAPAQGTGALLPRETSLGDQRLTFTYRPHGQGPVLHEITADSGPVLRLDRAPGKVAITYPGDNPAVCTLTLDSDGRIAVITLPAADEAQWRFGYAMSEAASWITTLRTPTGTVESYEYESGTQGGAPPRVVAHRVDPGAGQAVALTRYSYTEPGFSGPGAPAQTQPADTFPPIGDTSYTYGSTATVTVGGKPAKTVTLRYDHLHRAILEETTTNGHVESIIHRYLPSPANEISTTMTWTTGTGALRIEEHSHRFDSHGNVIEARTPETRTVFTYAPADADGFTHLKDTTVYSLATGEVLPSGTPDRDDRDFGPITIR